jgi:hypothetical protein
MDFSVWGFTMLGAACFGLVIGWVTYRTLRRSAGGGLSDISTVIGAVGGAAVTGLFSPQSGAFGSYSIGLMIGFFGYAFAAIKISKSEGKSVDQWLGAPAGGAYDHAPIHPIDDSGGIPKSATVRR